MSQAPCPCRALPAGGIAFCALHRAAEDMYALCEVMASPLSAVSALFTFRERAVKIVDQVELGRISDG